MALIEWNDSLSVKVAELDNQHKQWIRLINQMHDAMLAGKGRDSVKPIMHDVVAYADTHFTREEELMKAHRFPGFIRHQLQHKAFVQQIQALEKGTIYSVDVMKLLQDWLLAHIKTVDSQYSEYLNGCGIR